MNWNETLLDFSPFILATTVFTASLLGSLHCMGMCGPILASVTPTRATALLYHAGRLMSYATIGALAGHLGDAVLSGVRSKEFALMAAMIFSLALFAAAHRLFRGQPPAHWAFLTRLPAATLRKTMRLSGRLPRSFGLGVLTPLLPCAWLYSFALGAALTERAALGGLFMASFWLGTLPALGLLPLLREHLSRRFSLRINRLAGGLFVAAAIGVVAVRVLSIYRDLNCH